MLCCKHLWRLTPPHWKALLMSAQLCKPPRGLALRCELVYLRIRSPGLSEYVNEVNCQLPTAQGQWVSAYNNRKDFFMKKIRAISFGIGAMGKMAARMMLEKGIEIVAAVDLFSHIGEDFGDVLGLDHPLNLTVTRELDAVLSSTEADVAVVCARSYVKDMMPILEKFASHGINVVTLAEELFYPWRRFPTEAEELDKLCKANKATITSCGIQDVLWLNLLSVMSGGCYKIDSVLGQATSNVDAYGPSAVEAIGVGQTEQQFRDRLKTQKFDYSWFGISLEGIIARLGLTFKDWKEWVEPVLAKKDTPSHSLGKVLPPASVIGWNQITEIYTEEGITFRSEFISKICVDDETENARWHIEGTPSMDLVIPVLPGPDMINTSLLNRIPDVINSAPGFFTLDQLPYPLYRSGDLAQYLKD